MNDGAKSNGGSNRVIVAVSPRMSSRHLRAAWDLILAALRPRAYLHGARSAAQPVLASQARTRSADWAQSPAGDSHPQMRIDRRSSGRANPAGIGALEHRLTPRRRRQAQRRPGSSNHQRARAKISAASATAATATWIRSTAPTRGNGEQARCTTGRSPRNRTLSPHPPGMVSPKAHQAISSRPEAKAPTR